MCRCFRKHFSGLLSIVLCLMAVVAYTQTDYIPRKTYDESSRELISASRDQLKEELSQIQSKKKILVAEFYTGRTNYLIRGIKQKAFINDDSLQQLTDVILQRLVRNNTIHHQPKKILILKSPQVNALCFGEGTFVINVGLLSRLRNEGQLAFTIAHELAHYELNHVRQRIVLEAETRVSKTTSRGVTKVLTEDVTLEEIDSLRRQVYDLSRFNREKEREADSLGSIYLHNAGYDQSQAIAMMNLLDSAEHAQYPNVDLLKPFRFSKFPFQDYWLKQRPRVFSKKTTNTLFFSNDSINSHPEIVARKAMLASVITKKEGVLNYLPQEYIKGCAQIAAFESIESAYANKLYDRCLFLALQQFARDPRNTYLVSVITKVLIDLHNAKNDGTFHYVVPGYTSYYSDELRQVNNFLYNLTREEMGEIAFNFLNNQSNFNAENEEHYVLLWKVCTMTRREAVATRIRETYFDRFGRGKFAGKFK